MKKNLWILFFPLYSLLTVAGQVCFRQGGVYEDLYWPLFFLGNLMGWMSTWVLMLIYARSSSVNVAQLASTSLTFAVSQTTMWLCFSSVINWQMVAGMAVMLAGILFASFDPGKKECVQEV